MNFTRDPTARFVVKGMNLRRQIDQIPPGEYSYLKNTRVIQDGMITIRPGVKLWYTFPGAQYLHSIVRLNDSNPQSTWKWAQVVGTDDGKLYVGQTVNAATTFGANWNPVASGFSGHPLSFVPTRPFASSVGALYVADTVKMISVIFRPVIDDFTTGPTVYPMGVPPPNNAIIPADSGSSGKLNGTYWWRFVARNRYTGARSNPSNPTRLNITPDATQGGLFGGLTLTNHSATMTVPTTSAFGTYTYGTGAGADFVIDVYRFGGTVFNWHFVATVDPATYTPPFTDNYADLDILSAPTLPLDAAGNFALYMPFPIQDAYRGGSGSITFTQPGGAGQPYIGTFSATPTGGTAAAIRLFEGYIPGTAITIVGTATFHTYRYPDSATAVEIAEDITLVGLGTGTPYAYEIYQATSAGQPLPHLWGPLVGSQPGGLSGGLYLFACGDPLNPGTVYWTNGNDPDSSALTNSLEVTDPSEPLQNGLVWSDGRDYLWSTQKAFELVPDFLNPGNFLARQIPHMGGLYAPWALVDCGDFMAYIGYDGLYATQGVGSESLSDAQLYPWFPHDASPGIDFSRGGDDVGVADPSALDKWRLSWQDGVLYFDWPPVEPAS